MKQNHWRRLTARRRHTQAANVAAKRNAVATPEVVTPEPVAEITATPEPAAPWWRRALAGLAAIFVPAFG